MQTQCEYISHASTDASDNRDDVINTYEEASHVLKRNRGGKKNIPQTVGWQEAAPKFYMNITFVKKSDILPEFCLQIMSWSYLSFTLTKISLTT